MGQRGRSGNGKKKDTEKRKAKQIKIRKKVSKSVGRAFVNYKFAKKKRPETKIFLAREISAA